MSTISSFIFCFFFFFQAEDGIRDVAVTGVQTCALPIWSDQAWDDVESCHPPLHEMSERSHGLAFIRWLLHSVLPYPAFLYDTHRLAARLRVSPVTFRRTLERSRRLDRVLAAYRYNGIVAGFLGQRWGKAGIE